MFYPEATLQELEVDEWDVRGAYPGIKTDPDFKTFLRQPRRTNGTLTLPGCPYAICTAQQAAPDAGFRLGHHRDSRPTALGWTLIKSEAKAFTIHQAQTLAKLLYSTDEFPVAINSGALLSHLCRQLRDEWDITV